MLKRKGIYLWGILLYAFLLIWAIKPEGFDKGMIAYKANDFEKAYQIWMPLAEQGHAEAQYCLGNMLCLFPKEYWQEASKWLILARNASQPKAEQALLALHEKLSDIEIAQSRQMAQSWIIAQYNVLLLRASEGKVINQMLLGLMYSSGENASKFQMVPDMPAGSNLFHDTQVMLGMFYFERLAKDSREILPIHQWFLSAIKAGHRDVLLASKTSTQDATRWYELAAEQGIPEAQLVLSIVYMLGNEVEVDFVSAYKWMILAIHSSAEGYVGYIGNQLKKSIETEMSEEQLALAYQFAQRWNTSFQQRSPRQPI